MFDKVLIANRGAIATRICRTLKRLGVTSIAVYADCDADSLHVRHADESWSLGEGGAADTYLNVDRLLEIAQASGAQAIHPGYGFLSENSDFARRCEAVGLAFIGPTGDQMESFGLKHRARELAQKAGVPLLPGTELLTDLQAAIDAAQSIGYPVMLKTTAGGGGIGMQLCHSDAELSKAFESVKRLGKQNFSDDGVFLEKFIERARHIEVQIIADGQGEALALGERDCSSQRRNQKVVEECPAPHLTDAVRDRLHRTAEQLLGSVAYRNAGTVEFIFDADTEAFYFLEVNTRLQVEHGVTEEVYGVDLVEWMLRVAAGEAPDLRAERQRLKPCGHSVQVRVYAEDPWRNFQPCAGLLSDVSFPSGEGIRIDSWVESGVEVPPYFDPMLAKVIVRGADRASAFEKLTETLDQIRLYGSETNLDYLRALVRDEMLLQGRVTTRYLNDFRYQPARIDVLQGGTQTTVQDFPGRQGHWDVGVPPSGPFDSLSFQLGNRLLNNAPEAAGLEITLQGPTLAFARETQIALTGATIEAVLEDLDSDSGQGASPEPVALNEVVTVSAGQRLKLGRIREAGARAYLTVRGGIHCPKYLGSRATFTLGQFGGHNGRALRTGDVLKLDEVATACPVTSLPETLQPVVSNDWELRVIYGPHGAPEFFTESDIETFFSTAWEIHYNSSRTGIRLIGPKPEWARADGGEAGLHPSNIHDNAYAFGTVDFTGDMPVILGPDGPSLGGFVCPATVITADLWKLGQLRAGDRVRFVPVSIEDAIAVDKAQRDAIAALKGTVLNPEPAPIQSAILKTLSADEFGDEIVFRAAGDRFVLIEYGERQLDIRLRFRVHALMNRLRERPLPGLLDLTPGIRSLQIHFDSQKLSHQSLFDHVESIERELSGSLDEMALPSRIVHLPLSWDDEACREAIEKYQQSVRKNAPWYPSNLEFIRRINGLDDLDAVKDVLFNASYLVMGLGDVYLGAPVATPIDPRHRLVTTKYNPARTWTAENSVGIGGSYLCVYGMEGPGGYQFVGRTLQMWNRYRKTVEFPKPWLLRFFDQIRFYEVSHDELQTIRRDFPQGRYPLKIEETRFSLADHEAFMERERTSIDAFLDRRNQAFEEELERWHRDGQFNFETETAEKIETEADWPEESLVADSPVSGNVWKVLVAEGDEVSQGDVLMILESMKMEVPIEAAASGQVTHVLANAGGRVNAGQPVVVMLEHSGSA